MKIQTSALDRATDYYASLKGSRTTARRAKPRESRTAFIAWLWSLQPQIIALAREQSRNDVDCYDIATDALLKSVERANMTPAEAEKRGIKKYGVQNRGDAHVELRSSVQQLCAEYRAERNRLTANRNHRRRTEHVAVSMRRVQGVNAERAVLRAASDATIWDELRTQYLPIYTREGPGPCNLCGCTVWWTALNWGARKGGARWMRKWEVIGAKRDNGKLAPYGSMRPSGQRHICGHKDRPRGVVLLRPGSAGR